jgi:hypothetical protein
VDRFSKCGRRGHMREKTYHFFFPGRVQILSLHQEYDPGQILPITLNTIYRICTKTPTTTTPMTITMVLRIHKEHVSPRGWYGPFFKMWPTWPYARKNLPLFFFLAGSKFSHCTKNMTRDKFCLLHLILYYTEFVPRPQPPPPQ